ncbi:helix-turn-helix transcriptional regulator [Streptomyces sp. NBC_01276]|uniref:helix-turn-helix transcriptional regulator n=1 Tax=Streptomyces sp. NBC_01276 TaxID=2903808 RepID=UPI00352EC515
MVRPTRVTNAIRAQRFAHGEMTQAELARRIGVSRQTVIAIEQGRYSPTLEMAFQIAAVFGVPLDQVFQYSATTPPRQRETRHEGSGPGRLRTPRGPARRRDRTARPRPRRGPPEGPRRGVDQGVWHLMSGRPHLLRALGFGLRAPRVRTPTPARTPPTAAGTTTSSWTPAATGPSAGCAGPSPRAGPS